LSPFPSWHYNSTWIIKWSGQIIIIPKILCSYFLFHSHFPFEFQLLITYLAANDLLDSSWYFVGFWMCTKIFFTYGLNTGWYVSISEIPPFSLTCVIFHTTTWKFCLFSGYRGFMLMLNVVSGTSVSLSRRRLHLILGIWLLLAKQIALVSETSMTYVDLLKMISLRDLHFMIYVSSRYFIIYAIIYRNNNLLDLETRAQDGIPIFYST